MNELISKHFWLVFLFKYFEFIHSDLLSILINVKKNQFFLQEHPWIKKYEHEPVDIAGWVCSTMNLPPSTPN